MSSSPKTRPREQDDLTPEEPDAKRTKIEDVDKDISIGGDREVAVVSVSELEEQDAMDTTADKEPESLLPPSHALLNAPPPVYGPDGEMQQIMETDVGISEYIGFDVPKIEGIIKQRCVRSVRSGVHACLCARCVGSRTSSCLRWTWTVRSST